MWLAVQPEGCITPPESDGNPVEQLRSADGRIARVGSLGDGLPERVKISICACAALRVLLGAISGRYRHSTCNRYFKEYRYRYVWGYG